MQIEQSRKSEFFWKCHLEKWNLKNKIYKVQDIPGFELKFQVFHSF